MKTDIREQWTRLKISINNYQTLLTWSALLLGALIVSLWAILPYTEWRTIQKNHIQQALEKAAKLQALQKSIKHWQNADAQSKIQFDEHTQAFFNASSYTQAQQDLFNLLNSTLAQNHLRLITHSFSENTAVAVGEQIAVQLSIQGALVDLLHFISTLSHHEKRLTFPNLYLFQNTDTAMLQLTVTGYRLKSKSA